MNRSSHAFVAVSILAALLSAGLFGCSSGQHVENRAPESISDVSVITIHKATVPDWMEAVGTVRAGQTTQVSSQMMGTIHEIRAHEGDPVQPGQILATIDDSQPRARVDQATAALTVAEKEVSAADSDLALAESTLKRYQQLYEKKSLSPQEFDEIKTRYQSAQARRDMARAGQARANAVLAQARNSLGYTLVRAPFAGTVIEKKADVGALASPGMPIFTIEDTRNYRLEVTVDENDIRIIRRGQNVPVFLDSLGNAELAGKVVQIVPTADAASRSFLVKIELPAKANLHSGLFGRARFPRGERSVLLIPRTCLVERGQLQGAYVLDANRVAGLRYVTLGKSTGETVEILSGLQDGETLITKPGNREFGGKRIGIQP
jgi:membrane fusion protein, multidrug efflux system